MKSLKREIEDFIRYGFTPRNKRLDTLFENIVARKTGFKARDIEVDVAKKIDINKHNEFDYFEFTYHKVQYILEKDVLKKYE